MEVILWDISKFDSEGSLTGLPVAIFGRIIDKNDLPNEAILVKKGIYSMDDKGRECYTMPPDTA